ncbi:MAG TPA: hypothetical protein GXZ55_09470 [Natronincola sp.]|nr:hypothetical protein [Natronincola sp.]
MTEREWTLIVQKYLSASIAHDKKLAVKAFERIPYALEVMGYSEQGNHDLRHMGYETDLVITETVDDGIWKPRVIVELKLDNATTHDAITYSQKAFTHKNVHPYLRYGILIGKSKSGSLAGRLFRHGAHFDFMASWDSFQPTESELEGLTEIINLEIEASRVLEESIYSSRSPNRERYTFLHRPLKLY